MDTNRRISQVLVLIALSTSLSLSNASAAVYKKDNPASKLFVADLEGTSEINTGEKIEDLTKKSVHSAQGTVIQTKKDATNALVFSNGTGIFFDPDTRMEVRRFVQEPFTPNRSDMDTEPSISNTWSYLNHGTVGLCTSKMVSSSAMTYSTAHGSATIRGKKIVVQATDEQTVISLLEGDVTVRGNELDMGGQSLKPGQQAILTPGPIGGPSKVEIQDIPKDQLAGLNKKVTAACMARQTVYFDVAERKNKDKEGNERDDIIARPVIPGEEELPRDQTVSPSRMANAQGGTG